MARRDLRSSFTAVAMIFALLATALFVDTHAEAPFDAPKRFFCLLGIGIAAIVQFGFADSWSPIGSCKEWSGTQRTTLALFLLGLIGLAVAAAASPKSGVSLDAYRSVLLFALLLPLGASAAVDAGRSYWVTGAFLGASTINAILAIAQVFGSAQLYTVERYAGRTAGIALVGNEGLLALNLSCAIATALAIMLNSRTAHVRGLAAAMMALFAVGLILTHNTTAFVTGAAGMFAVLITSESSRRWVSLMPIVGLFGVALLLAGVTSGRLGGTLKSLQSRDWDALLTFRLGAWSSAVEMIRERPLLGFGPGTFGAEFMSHRLDAEIRFHRRFLVPNLNSSFAQAHSDYLQGIAEAGIPAASALLASAIVLLSGVARVASHGPAIVRGEAVVVLAMLVAGAVSALTWFPLQSPISAAPLLICAGRAWSLLGQMGTRSVS